MLHRGMPFFFFFLFFFSGCLFCRFVLECSLCTLSPVAGTFHPPESRKIHLFHFPHAKTLDRLCSFPGSFSVGPTRRWNVQPVSHLTAGTKGATPLTKNSPSCTLPRDQLFLGAFAGCGSGLVSCSLTSACLETCLVTTWDQWQLRWCGLVCTLHSFYCRKFLLFICTIFGSPPPPERSISAP